MARTPNPEILIYEPIGADPPFGGISAKQVVEALRPHRGRQVTIRLNSPGGNAADGVAIYNQLRMHPGGVVVHVDSEASSAASIVAMGGTQVLMARGSLLMIHNPYSIVAGDADRHRQAAAFLENVTSAVIDIYHAKTAIARDKIAAWMAVETWWTADAAVADGLADGLLDAPAVAACSDRSLFQYQNTPAELLRPPRRKTCTRTDLRDWIDAAREEALPLS